MEQDLNATKIRNELIQAAKYKKQVAYIMLHYLLGTEDLDKNQIDTYLREVSITEHKDGKPILWPLVIDEETGLPAEGYFDLLKKLNLIDEATEPVHYENIYEEGLEEVFSYWSKRKKTGRSGTKKRF